VKVSSIGGLRKVRPSLSVLAVVAARAVNALG